MFYHWSKGRLLAKRIFPLRVLFIGLLWRERWRLRFRERLLPWILCVPRFCFGREHLICSRDLVRQKNLRKSDLRKKVNRLRRKAVPIASSREGYFYASNAAELYSTIRQLKEMRAGLDAAICGLEQAMETFTEPSDGGGRDR